MSSNEHHPRRNLGIIAHIDAGKTTLTEQLLCLGGVVRRPGSVEDGSTVSDWMDQEQRRGITIGSAAVTCHSGDVAVTLIDTPGHVDFTWEVSRCLRVLDGAVVVLSGPDGVQAQTQTVWHQAAEHDIPMIGWINKLDRPGLIHDELLAEIEEVLAITPVPMQLPLEYGSGVVTVLDIVTGERRTWRDATKQLGTRSPTLEPTSADEELLRELALERLGDAVASYDDALAEILILGGTPRPEDWIRAMAAAVRARACLPLYYGCARAGIGIGAIMDAIVSLLPAPHEALLPLLLPIGGEGSGEPIEDETPLLAYVFKTETRSGGRRVAWVRVFAGALERGVTYTRLPVGAPFVPELVVQLEGGWETPIPRLGTGEVGGVLCSPEVPLPRTGETLVLHAMDRCVEPSGPPSPVLAITLEPQRSVDLPRLRSAIAALVDDDDSLALSVDRDTGQLILAGMGELHLEVMCERLRRDQELEFRTGTIQPRRQRSLVARVEGTGAFHLGESPDGEVEVTLRLEPSCDDTSSILFAADIQDAQHRSALIDGVRQILYDRADLHGVTALIVAVHWRGGGLTPRCFWEAGSHAAAECLAQATLVDLLPWVRLTLVVPENRIGGVLGDLGRRGVRIRSTVGRGSMQVLTGEAPLGSMIDYATDMRSLTGGRGSATIEALGFRPA